MDEATKKAIDDYRALIEKDEHAPYEGSFGVTMTYSDGVEVYRPFCEAINHQQMNRFEPEDYSTMAEAEAHIRTFLGSALAKEQGRRDGSGKIIRQAGLARR